MWGHVDDQDVRAPTLRCAGDPQRPRVRRLSPPARPGIDFVKEGNCFTALTQPEHLAQIADTVSQPGAAGLLRDGVRTLDLQRLRLLRPRHRRTGRAAGSATPTRCTKPSTAATCCSPTGPGCNASSTLSSTAPDHASTCRWCAPCSGRKSRPHRDRKSGPPRLAAVIETPRYDLTTFKIHFGRLTLKAYTKGEHVLRVEAITHNTAELNCGRVLEHVTATSSPGCGRWPRTFCTTLGLHRHRPSSLTVCSTSSRSHYDDRRHPRRWHRHQPRPDAHHHRRRDSPWPSPPPASPSPISPPRCTRSPAPPPTTTRSVKPPTTCASCAPKPLVDRIGRSHRYTRSDPHAARVVAGLVALREPGPRPGPGRRPPPPPGTQTVHLDRHRPRLRTAPHRHARSLFDDLAIDRAAA